MTCGIYSITHSKSGRVYVGSGANIENRWSTHKATLNSGKHHNLYLQRCWHKYGPKAFEFKILEECTKELLTQREQHWMEELQVLDRSKGFNIQPTARSPLGQKLSPAARAKIKAAAVKRGQTPEFRAEVSERAKRQWAEGSLKPVSRSQESIERYAAKRRGYKFSPEVKERMRQSALRRWSDPEERRKFGDRRRGEKRSPEVLEKMRIAQQARRAREKAK